MSSTQELEWLLTRKTSCFLVKQKGLARVFSREPSNLAQIHSYRYSGLVNEKTVSIKAADEGRGIVISTKKAGVPSNKIASARESQTIKKGGPQQVARAVVDIVKKDKYRHDLLHDAAARSAAVYRAQNGNRKQPPAKKTRGRGSRKVVLL